MHFLNWVSLTAYAKEGFFLVISKCQNLLAFSKLIAQLEICKLFSHKL